MTLDDLDHLRRSKPPTRLLDPKAYASLRAKLKPLQHFKRDGDDSEHFLWRGEIIRPMETVNDNG